jgi:hypothetical protein
VSQFCSSRGTRRYLLFLRIMLRCSRAVELHMSVALEEEQLIVKPKHIQLPKQVKGSTSSAETTDLGTAWLPSPRGRHLFDEWPSQIIIRYSKTVYNSQPDQKVVERVLGTKFIHYMVLLCCT